MDRDPYEISNVPETTDSSSDSAADLSRYAWDEARNSSYSSTTDLYDFYGAPQNSADFQQNQDLYGYYQTADNSSSLANEVWLYQPGTDPYAMPESYATADLYGYYPQDMGNQAGMPQASQTADLYGYYPQDLSYGNTTEIAGGSRYSDQSQPLESPQERTAFVQSRDKSIGPGPKGVPGRPPEGYHALKGKIPTGVVKTAQSLLGGEYGTMTPFEINGKRYMARVEPHYHPPGYKGGPNGWHKGVTVYEAN